MGLSPATLYKLEEDVYEYFKCIVYHTIYRIHDREDRRKVMDIIKHEAPHLHFSHGFVQKVTSLMLRYMPYLYIEIYYIYGQIVYKKKWKIWKR